VKDQSGVLLNECAGMLATRGVNGVSERRQLVVPNLEPTGRSERVILDDEVPLDEDWLTEIELVRGLGNVMA
jgi:hypothetical protein